MAEAIVLDPAAVSDNRSALDITPWLQADPGVDWGDAAIQAYVADQEIGSTTIDYRLPNRQIKIPLNLRAVGGTSFANIRLSLQQKVAIFQAEGGSILRWANPSFSVLDTNWVPNPSFEYDIDGSHLAFGWSTTNPTGWTHLNAGSTITITSAQHSAGGKGLQVVTTSALANEGVVVSVGVIPAGTYTLSMDLKGNAGGELVTILGGPDSSPSSSALTLTSSFARYSVQVTSDGINPTFASVYTTGAAVCTFFLDAVMIGHTSSYADGDSDGWEWNASYLGQYGRVPSQTEGDLYADVVNATLHFGGGALAAYRNLDVDAVLQLECLPDWYGPEVFLDGKTATTVLTGPLKLGGGTAVVAGNYPGRTRIFVSDTSGNDQKGLLWGFRSRHYDAAVTAALSYEADRLQPLNGAAGTALSGASGGSAVYRTTLPTDVWAGVLHTNMGTAGTAALTHQGSYRVWARVWAGTALPAYRLVWGVGSLANPVTNDAVVPPVGGSAFSVLDLGSVQLAKPPAGNHEWHGVIQAKVAVSTDQVAIDQLFFQPLDEAAGRLAYGGPQLSVSLVSSVNPAGTAAGTATVGTLAWSNPNNVVTSGSFTSATNPPSSTGTTNYLVLTNFGFSIPAGATIEGFEARVPRAANTPGNITDGNVRAVKAGSIQTTDRSAAGFWSITSPTTQVYGSASDLWGASWTPSDINSSGFGLAFNAVLFGIGHSLTAVVYNPVTITVYYALASGFTVSQDAVVYAGGSAELRTEGMFRDGGSGVYGQIASVLGDLPRIPPSRLEARPVELFVKPSRSDLSGTSSLSDAGLDGMFVTVYYRPSFLFVGV